jgi:hypothetical protein
MAERVDIQAILNEIIRRENESARRLRALEEMSSLIETRISTVEDSILKLTEERKGINETTTIKFDELDKNIIRIDSELLKISKNVEKMAKRTELKEIENLISIYNPIRTNFITREEVERLIEERLKNVSI